MEEIGASDWLRHSALMLVPPDMRDAIAGDLEELYGSSWRYLAQLLLVIPFAIAGRVRRNLFPPVLLAQAGLAWLLGGPGLAALVVAVLVPFAAYRSQERPSEKRVVAEACVIAYAATILIQSVTLAAPHDWLPLTHQRLAGLQLFFLAPFLLPIFCLFGTAVVARRADPSPAAMHSRDELARTCRLACRRAARRDLLDAAGLLLVLIPLWRNAPLAMATALLTLANGGAALYLLAKGTEAPMPPEMEALRRRYRRLLSRQQRLRGLVWWLWAVSLTLFVQDCFAASGGIAGLVATTVAPLLLCYCLLVLGREETGLLQDHIRHLGRQISGA